MPTLTAFHSVFEKFFEKKWDPLHTSTLHMQFTENLTHYYSLLNYRVPSLPYHLSIE